MKVVSQDGLPVQAGVVLRDQTGHVLQETISNRDGIAEFCDLGSELFDVVVGPNLCGQAIVRYLRFDWWPHTAEVKVFHANCHQGAIRGLGGCAITLRVRSVDGKPLQGVSFSAADLATDSRPTDSYGRLFTVLAWGKRLEGVLKKAGYREHRLSVACEPGTSYQKEEFITLQPVADGAPGKR
ncbi:MAG: hypothetical protein AAB403_20435 [Planctomycetota bacterium]